MSFRRQMSRTARVPTLYADNTLASQAWERALLVARPDTVVVRDAPPPKSVEEEAQVTQKRPFLACRGIVTALTETAFPDFLPQTRGDGGAPTVRPARWAAFDDRRTWEPHDGMEAPSQLKHVFQGDAYKEALAIVDPVARAAPVVARILEVLRRPRTCPASRGRRRQPRLRPASRGRRPADLGADVDVRRRGTHTAARPGRVRQAAPGATGPETWRRAPLRQKWTCRTSRPARPTGLFPTTSTHWWCRARRAESASRPLRMSTKNASSLTVGRCPR